MKLKIMLASLELFKTRELNEDVLKFLERFNGNVFIILDESSKIKTNTPVSAKKSSLCSRNILLLNSVGHRLIMTGTFMTKTPLNAYNQMEFLQKDFFKMNQWQFFNKYCVTMQIPRIKQRILITPDIYKRVYKGLWKAKEYGYRAVQDAFDKYARNYGLSREDMIHIAKHADYTPFKYVDELMQKVRELCLVVRKEDIVQNLPQKIYTSIPVDATQEMYELYNSLLDSGFIEVDGEEIAYNGVSIYHRFQDICNGYIPITTEDSEIQLERQKSNPKLDALVDLLDDIDISTAGVVIFSNRKLLLHDTVQRLQHEGYSVALYDGTQKEQDKIRALQDFESGACSIICCNQHSAAYGLNSLSRASYAIFLSSDYSVETRHQAELRIDRGFHTNTKFVYDIIIKHSIDEKIVENLKAGKELLNASRVSKSLFLWS